MGKVELLLSNLDESLPSRGAWIEIPRSPRQTGGASVAPLAGSVDRNQNGAYLILADERRSPRGERG